MQQSIDAVIRALRIVIVGMMMGLVSFSVVALVVGPLSRGGDSSLGDLMLLVLVGLALSCAAAYVLIQRSTKAQLAARAAELRHASDPSSLVLEAYRRSVIIGAALTEAPGFLGIVTYLLTGAIAGLGAVVLALGLLAMQLPSSERLRGLAEGAAR
jgi:hypothetical protein